MVRRPQIIGQLTKDLIPFGLFRLSSTGVFFIIVYTVNVEFFAQDMFSRNSRRALDMRKFDVSKNYYHNKTNRINWYVRENLAAQICILMLDAPKFSGAKICTFTVYIFCHLERKPIKVVITWHTNSLKIKLMYACNLPSVPLQ